MKFKSFNLLTHEDEQGALLPIEVYEQIPFLVKRAYFVYCSDFETVRGLHAHKELQQVMFVVNGSCDILLDDGHHKEKFNMRQREKALFLDKMVWREMSNFSENCILAVLASDVYTPSDYIHDYDDFIEKVRNDSSAC
ncbi:FdtA/QdtA family cupin domain-containing protein [Emcibacteraceae bacterium]|nr:FdtA/QdtA family cupin domain-containing protein [Emcibacteraceae bacterium]